MRRFLSASWLVFAGLTWTPAAQAQFVISETQLVDKSYKTIRINGRTGSSGEYEKLHYFKAFEKNGKLNVCGAVTANVTPLTQNAILDGLRNLRTVLVVGKRDDQAAPRISPLPFVRFNSFSTPLEQMQADCIATQYDWQPAYARTPLSLTAGAGIGR